jgi:hypothetical protein
MENHVGCLHNGWKNTWDAFIEDGRTLGMPLLRFGKMLGKSLKKI